MDILPKISNLGFLDGQPCCCSRDCLEPLESIQNWILIATSREKTGAECGCCEYWYEMKRAQRYLVG